MKPSRLDVTGSRSSSQNGTSSAEVKLLDFSVGGRCLTTDGTLGTPGSPGKARPGVLGLSVFLVEVLGLSPV